MTALGGRYVTLHPDIRMEAAIFDDLTALADATRSRMLLVLERHELTVSELCAVLQLPQSTVSRHLKTLLDAGWVASRRDGTSRYYTLALDDRGPATRRLWALLREQVSLTPGADQDARRLRGVLGRRQSKSQEFFASAAGQWDRLRQDLFGRASLSARAAGTARPRVDRRRPRLRHGPGRGGARAVRQAGDRRRSLERHAAGGAPPRPRSAQRRRAAGRARSAADLRTARSTPRRCCSCCTTCRIPSRRSPKPRACCGPAAAC